ncbi:MAG: helix-turn-helix transcriptional regulator [Myxococcales bacterium]|nr:helix-turn-helix transcriptional regulator [Myxococcales bacterium]
MSTFYFIVRYISNTRTEDQRFAKYFKALSNPHRLALFQQLTSCCAPGTVCSVEAATRCVGELGESLKIAKSTLSHHLKELNQAGLIQMERRGKQVMCWVDPEILKGLSGYFSQNLP